MKNAPRIEQLTATRFIAAILIVIFHFGRQIFPFNNPGTSFLFAHADVGVSYFFILSGFVMIIAYSGRSKVNAFEYLKNRFARIYPVYFLAIFLLVVDLVITRMPVNLLELLLNILTLQTWVPGKALSLNFPGWSIGTEFLFYVTFPFLFNYFYKKRDYRSFVIPISLIWLISQVAFHLAIKSPFYHGYPSPSHDLFFFFPLMHFNEFLIGNLTGLFFVNRLQEKTRNYDWLIITLLALIVLSLKMSLGLNFHNGLLSLLFVPLILVFSMNNGKITSIARWKFFVFLGEISYGVYILQYPVLLWARDLSNGLHISNPFAKFHLFLFLLIVISSVSYLCFEAPLRKVIKSIKLNKKQKHMVIHKIPPIPASVTAKVNPVGDHRGHVVH